MNSEKNIEHKKYNLKTRITIPQKNALLKIAKKEGGTLSDVIRKMVERKIARYQKQK